MTSANSRNIAAPIGHSLSSKELIRCVVILEDRPAMRERLQEMLVGANWVVITTEDWRECKEWALRNVRIFVLDIALPNEPTGGFRALEEIKQVAPEAFCAIVTEDVRRLGYIASNLHADHQCGKSDAEMEALLRRLDSLASPLAEREQARSLGQRLFDCFPAIDGHLIQGNISAAEHALIQMEAALSEAVRLESLGQDFATVIDALHFALINAPGHGLTLEQWNVWKQVAREAFQSFPLGLQQALDLPRQLEEAGWDTYPPNFSDLASFLLDGEGEEETRESEAQDA
jgi:CheY-like chemotaxis protein